MGTRYEVVVTLDCRTDLADDDLAVLRWLVGEGPRPAVVPEPDGLPALDAPLVPSGGPVEGTLHGEEWAGVAGGQHVSLRYARRTTDAAVRWSVSAHLELGDDHLHHDGITALVWLATLSDREGVYAWARSEYEPFPSVVLVASDRRAFLLTGPDLSPVEEGAEPSPVVVAGLRRFSGGLSPADPPEG
ncbi:hypothetical protein [Phycicoccus flavus]|uniref:hypothetical protein n=1 Tax=Phycicoccus flavus TaxID=2502783 RepID=UPI000FEB6222|nr:hypothetical protein [Phycicoccus flavus]NHA67022.1 hypothetical protein [Phycicoccus flavus]